MHYAVAVADVVDDSDEIADPVESLVDDLVATVAELDVVVDDVEFQSSSADDQVSGDFDVIEGDELCELAVVEEDRSDSVDEILRHSENFEQDSDEIGDESAALDAEEHFEDKNFVVCYERKPDWDQ